MYGSLFGGSELVSELRTFDEQTRLQQQAFLANGLGEGAIQQYLKRREIEFQWMQLRLERERDRRAAGISMAVILALIIAMVLESLYSPKLDQDATVAEISPVIGRLVTVRYALMAMWIAVVLARPSLIHTASVTFGVLLIGFTFVFGLLPLGKHD